MKDQINTIRAAVDLCLLVNPEKAEKALTALTQLEAMVGEQEPIGTATSYRDGDGQTRWSFVPKDLAWTVKQNQKAIERGVTRCFDVFAAPVAQQYEAGDVASASAQGFRDGVASVTQQEPVAWAMPKGDGTFIDVITPAEHARDEGSYTVPLFAHPVAQQPQAKPHKPLFADLIAQHPGLREELKAMDEQQPQAEAVPRTHVLVPKRMTRAMERVTEEEGWAWADLLAAAESITEAEYGEIQMDDATPQQAEAVPPDVEVIRKALERAFIMGQNYWADADSESYSANKRSDVTRQKFNAMRDEVCAAIAQQKGGV